MYALLNRFGACGAFLNPGSLVFFLRLPPVLAVVVAVVVGLSFPCELSVSVVCSVIGIGAVTSFVAMTDTVPAAVAVGFTADSVSVVFGVGVVATTTAAAATDPGCIVDAGGRGDSARDKLTASSAGGPGGDFTIGSATSLSPSSKSGVANASTKRASL